jgi:hypothetical protein
LAARRKPRPMWAGGALWRGLRLGQARDHQITTPKGRTVQNSRNSRYSQQGTCRRFSRPEARSVTVRPTAELTLTAC